MYIEYINMESTYRPIGVRPDTKKTCSYMYLFNIDFIKIPTVLTVFNSLVYTVVRIYSTYINVY